jgi:hypothetical protein
VRDFHGTEYKTLRQPITPPRREKRADRFDLSAPQNLRREITSLDIVLTTPTGPYRPPAEDPAGVHALSLIIRAFCHFFALNQGFQLFKIRHSLPADNQRP